MAKLKLQSRFFGAAVFAALLAGQIHGQTRTWVSGVGDDANPCSRTAPCKTFAGAISKTSEFGEINVLDPGGFGAVTITKSITIRSEGVGEGGVLVSGTNAIVVNVGATSTVRLQGLVVDGLNTGIAGISFVGAGNLVVEDCKIFEFTQSGINFIPNGSASLTVTNTQIYKSSTATSTNGAIYIAPSAGGGSTFALDNVTVVNNGNFGIQVSGVNSSNAVTGVIRNSTVSHNSGPGIQVTSTSVAANTLIDNVAITNNTIGVNVNSAVATVRLTNSVITQNATGLATTGGSIISLGTNSLAGNGTDGAPTSTITTK